MGQELTEWTARCAFLLYVLALWNQIGAVRSRGVRKFGVSRAFWTAGCVTHVVHVICAFALVHHWSHHEAYAHTAKVTAQFVGLSWGGGIYLNYAFTGLWVIDTAWWWMRQSSYERRSMWIGWSVQAFFIFMFFNATVIFAPDPTRWIALAAFVALAVKKGKTGFSPPRLSAFSAVNSPSETGDLTAEGAEERGGG